MKTTFLQISKERVFLKLIQNLTHSLNVWLAWILGVDQYVIQIYDNKDIQLFSQNLVNISLKGSRSIRKTKRHDLVFKVSVLDPESCFSFITFTNPHLIIGISEIQLGESPCPTKPIQRLANQRQRILVFDGDTVKIPIIYTKVEASIWLSIKKNKCSSGRCKKPDEAIGQVGFDVGFQGLQLYQPQAIDQIKQQLLTFF